MLHPLDEDLTLPVQTANRTEDSFLSSAVLAFKYFLVRDKRNRVAQQQAPQLVTPPLQKYNDKEEIKPAADLWGVIQVSGKSNVKEACEALAWDMEDSGLQVTWEEHQSVESSAQILIINVPLVFDKGGIESEIV